MGKLLQKLVHGIVPSWLTKVKSSPDSSPKKLLPFYRAGSNNTSSSSSITVPPPNNTAVPPLPVEKSTHQDESSSITTTSPSSSSMQRKESQAGKGESIHPHKESHHPEDVKEYSHHSFQQMLLLEDEMLLLEGDISSQSESGCRNFNFAAEPHANSSEERQKELQHMHEEDTHHSQDGGQKAQYDPGYHENAYQEMLGSKRKSRSLQSDDGEEEEDEEGGGGSTGSGDITRWVWKRRKGEKGVMSCELPESICSIVGNGKAVVKQSLEPHLALWESMVEMIVGNGLWELGNLEFLLYCYLSLNEPHLHPIIQSSFLQVLKDLERIS